MKKTPFYGLRIILTIQFILLINFVLYQRGMVFNVLSKSFWIPIFYGDSLGALLASLIKKDHKSSLIPKALIQGVVVTLYFLLFWKTDPATNVFMLIIHIFMITVFVVGLERLIQNIFKINKEEFL